MSVWRRIKRAAKPPPILIALAVGGSLEIVHSAADLFDWLAAWWR